MKSNFQMIRDFKDFKPAHFGFLSGEEVEKVRKQFELSERSDIELQNLRDFIVLYYSSMDDRSLEQMDIMSAIVGVIDEEKFNRGLPV